MHFARSEEQRELAATVHALLTRRSDSAAVRAAFASEAGYDLGLWRALCEQIGVTALAVPEEYDGFGASLIETAIVLEELGTNLAPNPLLASALATSALLLNGNEEQRAEFLPRIAAGELATVVLAADVVLEPAAAIVLVPTTDGLVVVDELKPVPAMDPTLRIGRLDGAIEPAPSAELLAIAAVLVSALQVGAMQRGLDITVAYAGERVQFGRPIGSFQALKHRMADLLVLLEASRSSSWSAGCAAAAHLAGPGAETAATLAEQAAVARSYCTDALEQVASETIQLHGGIAITWEHDAQLVFKRAHALNHLLGPAHLARAALLA